MATPEEIAALEAIAGQQATLSPAVQAPVEQFHPPQIGPWTIANAAAEAVTAPAIQAGKGLWNASGAVMDAAGRLVAPIATEITGQKYGARKQSRPAAAPAAPAQASRKAGAGNLQVSDAELEQRLLAAYGAPQVTTTTQSTGPALDPRLAAQLMRESSAIAQQRIAAQTQGQREYAEIAARRTKIREGLLADSQAMQARMGKAGKALSSRLDELDARIAEGEKALSEQEYTPLGRMSRMDQAILAITAAIEGGAAASLRRPSNAAAMIKQAIELDKQEYEEAVKSRIRSLNLDKDRQSAAMQRMQSVMSQMQEAAKRSAELQMAEIASRMDDTGRKMDAVNTALGIREGLTARKEQLGKAARGRATTTKIEKSGGPAGGKTSAADDKSVAGAITLLSETAKLKDFWNKHHPNELKGNFKGTKDNTYRGMVDQYGMALAKAAAGGQLNEEELKRSTTIVPRGTEIRPWGESIESGNAKFIAIEGPAYSKLAEAVIRDPQQLRKVPPAYRPGVISRIRELSVPTETQASAGFKER